ncbi:hypothetical protein F5141DRAFT_1066829 [Pisolithus sp. B1]|nr:hypothetical protein F5141DRAFT_1066829 [Pisolithus sp. B1]
MPSALHKIMPNSELPRILTLANTLKPPPPLRILPTKPGSHTMTKHVRFGTLDFVGRLVNVYTIPFNRGMCKAEFLFVACTREAFLVFSRFPDSGCKYALSNSVCMLRVKGTSFSSKLYSTASKRRLWICEHEDVSYSGEKGLEGREVLQRPSNVQYLPFLTPYVPLDS